MKYKAVIFDLDGVLCSTDQLHYQAWKAIADREKIPFSEQDNDRLRGVSRMESLNRILEKAGRAYTQSEREALAEEKNQIYRGLLQRIRPSDLSEDVRFTLDTLEKYEVRMAVGSSSKNTRTILHRLGIYERFAAISDGTNITKSKPAPEVFLKAAEMLALKPGDCLVVEDALAGIEAAANGGFDSAGIGEAGNSRLVTHPIERLSALLPLFAEQT